jgi:cell division protease FtsH
MSERLGMVQLAPRGNQFLGGAPMAGAAREISEETARAVDEEVGRIIGECHAEALELLGRHRRALDALAEALLQRETLDERDILEVTGLPPAPPLETHPRPANGAGARATAQPARGVA